ncbi:hypothetical protein HID58_055446, partial [Brassica napus]
QKNENHLFKWVDESLLDEMRRVDVDLKKTVEEEVRMQKNSIELGCLGSILWLFEKLSIQE